MIVLGVDPGTAITGYGIVKDSPNGRLIKVCYGVIRTDANMPYPFRLKEIYDEISSLIKTYKPQAVVIEQLFFNKNVSTALTVGQARGIVILAAAVSGIDLAEYTPIQVKEAVVGYGRAEKMQVQQMVKVLLGLEEIPKPDDAADALALAICHLNSYKMRSFSIGDYNAK
ncbi:MAG: crossover junction endodeoxyribonuclease RuvC [Candidatus Poribacteria bacterium]